MLTEVHLERRVWWLVGAATRWRRRSGGERWVVRFRLPDGSATDVVGWIEVLNPASVRLATADRAITVIERSMIIAARRAPAAAGGPAPAADLGPRSATACTARLVGVARAAG